jgi:hypothetical protein
VCVRVLIIVCFCLWSFAYGACPTALRIAECVCICVFVCVCVENKKKQQIAVCVFVCVCARGFFPFYCLARMPGYAYTWNYQIKQSMCVCDSLLQCDCRLAALRDVVLSLSRTRQDTIVS